MTNPSQIDKVRLDGGIREFEFCLSEFELKGKLFSAKSTLISVNGERPARLIQDESVDYSSDVNQLKVLINTYDSGMDFSEFQLNEGRRGVMVPNGVGKSDLPLDMMGFFTNWSNFFIHLQFDFSKLKAKIKELYLDEEFSVYLNVKLLKSIPAYVEKNKFFIYSHEMYGPDDGTLLNPIKYPFTFDYDILIFEKEDSTSQTHWRDVEQRNNFYNYKWVESKLVFVSHIPDPPVGGPFEDIKF